MFITAELLESKNACSRQVLLFKSLFPKGTEVTRELCLRYAQNFDFYWASKHLLTERQRNCYNEAMTLAIKAYDEAMAPAIKAYNEAMAPADKTYNEARTLTNKALNEAKALVSKVYAEAVTPVNKAYKEARAIAFYASIAQR